MDLTADERLSEYICDYVDGTMDPVVEEVFEEYMGQNTTVYNIVQSSLWSKNLLNQLPNYSTSSNFDTEFYNRLELERQIDTLLDSERDGEDQLSDNTNPQRQLIGQEDKNRMALWISLMCVMLMLIAASGFWIW